MVQIIRGQNYPKYYFLVKKVAKMSIVERINHLRDKNKFNYFGIMGATLTAGSCIASFVGIVILMNDNRL